MPRSATYPTLFDECKTLKVSDLIRWGYLKPNQYKTGTVTWSSNGNKTASISIALNTQAESLYIELDYKANGTPINYRVQLVSMVSNLGKGVVWFFICPHTRTRCRKLHLIGNYFFHRSAFRGCFYSKQVQNKYWRFLDASALGKELKAESIYEKIYTKHFKKYYNGKPTKRYQKLIKQVETLNLY